MAERTEYWVYVLEVFGSSLGELPKPLCKVGITGNPVKRIASLKANAPFLFSRPYQYWRFSSLAEVEAIEAVVLRTFADASAGGEWLLLEGREVANWIDEKFLAASLNYKEAA